MYIMSFSFWYMYVKSFLCLWNAINLIMINSILDMFWYLVCKYFIENFCIYLHQEDECIIFFVVYLFHFNMRILVSEQEFRRFPSFCVLWDNLRSYGVGSILKVDKILQWINSQDLGFLKTIFRFYFWQFDTFKQCILISPTQTPSPTPTNTPNMSTFHLHVLFSFLSFYEFSYCCLYAYGRGAVLQNMNKLPVTISLKKYHFPGPSSHQLPTVPQMGWSLLTCSPIWAGMLTDLMVHRLCKQVMTAVLSKEWNDYVMCGRQHLTAFFLSSNSHVLSVTSSMRSPESL